MYPKKAAGITPAALHKMLKLYLVLLYGFILMFFDLCL